MPGAINNLPTRTKIPIGVRHVLQGSVQDQPALRLRSSLRRRHRLAIVEFELVGNFMHHRRVDSRVWNDRRQFELPAVVQHTAIMDSEYIDLFKTEGRLLMPDDLR